MKDDGEWEDGDTRQRDLLMPELRLRMNSRTTIIIHVQIPVSPRRFMVVDTRIIVNIQIQKYAVCQSL
jgi:hypothetical protein